MILLHVGAVSAAPVHNGEPGTFWEDRVTAPWGSPRMNEQLMAALLAELRDVRAAVGWVAAAGAAAIPLYLAQAVDDNSLQPTYAIGAELARHKRPHEVRVYPEGGHGLFGRPDLWRADIAAFLTRWLG
jgi:fermentation-respiration switch protein FrsA (DUF1100 family)